MPLQLLSSNGFSWFVRTSGSLALNSVCVLHLSLGCCCLEGCNWLPPFFSPIYPRCRCSMALQRRCRTEPQWDWGVSPVVPLGLISSFLLIPASGSGRRPPKKTQKEREKKTLRKSRPNSMQFDVGNYREFFMLNF